MRAVALLLVAAAALSAVQLVQAQQCPTTVCDSKFANAMGGPIDCCKYRYSGVGGKCQWGGTPVSFTMMGSCSMDGKLYLTLAASNSQGPPGQANCRCKDAVAGGSGGNMVAVPGYPGKAGVDIPGQDVKCNGNNQYCQVCGTPAMVADRCKQTATCVAFTFDGKCGYLKYGINGMGARAGWNSYISSAATQNAMVQGYAARPGVDISGKDLPCDGKSYCMVCGPPSAVAARCNQGHKGGKCVAFTYDGKCGYIKYATDSAVKRSGYITYLQGTISPRTGPLALPGAGH